MKKFLILAALPLMLAACGNDDDEPKTVTLDYTELGVNYDAEAKLKASEKNCTWTSNNEFVATVDNDGTVKGIHVGKAVITVTSKDGATAKCNVTVNPTNTNFQLPYLSFGATRQQVIEEMKTSAWDNFSQDYDDDDSLGYLSNANDGFPSYSYAFNANGRLASAAMIMPVSMDDAERGWDFYGFLLQYYEDYGITGNDFLLGNATDPNDATIEVEYGLNKVDNTEYVQAVWGEPAKGSRSISDIKALAQPGLDRLVRSARK